MAKKRNAPNPDSRLLANAVVGGVGISIPENIEVPTGMGAVLLFVPLSDVFDKSPVDLQTDLGLPWYVVGGEPMWFDDIPIARDDI